MEKTGHEDKYYTNFSDQKFKDFPQEEDNSKVNDILSDKLEGNQKREFLKGAEIAYETILTAFAKGDNKSLKDLLTQDMNVSFEEAINQRNKNNIKSEITFVGTKSTLEKFEKIKNNFFATVKFVSEVISVKRDKDNKVIEGNPDKIKVVTDHWKFSKSVLSKKPNWYLSEIVSK